MDNVQGNKTAEQLEAEIRQTRARIEGDVDELGNKVNPSNLAENAKDMLGEAQDAVTSTVNDLTSAVSENASEWSTSLVDIVKRNPLPAALIGLGIGLLAAGGASASRSSGADSSTSSNHRSWDGLSQPIRGAAYNTHTAGATYRQLPESSSYTASSPGNNHLDVDNALSNANSQVKQTARRAKSGIVGWVEHNPLMAGAVVIAAGIGLGLAVPATHYEDDLMGQASDNLISKAKSNLGDTVDVVKETAKETLHTVQDEAKSKLDEINIKGSVKDKVKTAGHAVKDVAEKAKETAQNTAKSEAESRGLVS